MRSFWPRQVAVLPLPFPPFCTRPTFSASPLGRLSAGSESRARRLQSCSKGPKRAPCSSG